MCKVPSTHVMQTIHTFQSPGHKRCSLERCSAADKGPSIKYVTLFLANFDPALLPVTLCHTSRDPQKYVIHIGPQISSRPSTKNPDKSPLYRFSLNCLRRFLSGGFVFCLEGFVWGAFCPFPLCQNACVTTES